MIPDLSIENEARVPPAWRKSAASPLATSDHGHDPYGVAPTATIADGFSEFLTAVCGAGHEAEQADQRANGLYGSAACSPTGSPLGKGGGEGTGSGAYAGAGPRVNVNDRIVRAEIRAAEAEKRYVGHV